MADNIVVNPGTATIGTVATDDVSGTHFQRIKLDIGALDSSTPFTANTGITVGTLQNLNSGTITALAAGTITGGTVQNLVSGTVNALASGTITGGTLQNLVSGTINALASGTITGGTLNNLVSGTVNALASGTITGGTLQNLVSGTINALASGTITGGTLQNLVSGTINSGTVVNNGGTVIADNIQFRHADEFATVISTGTSDFGTIKAAVAGSVIYITDVIVSAGTATNVVIASGGTSTPIVGTLHFASNGGIAAPSFKVYPRTVSGSALVYKQSTNGPLTLTVNGYVD